MDNKVTPSELLPEIPKLLTPTETAKVLRKDPQTLAKWRSEGRAKRGRSSLPFVKDGDGPNARVLYRLSDVKQYIADHVRMPGPAKSKAHGGKK